ncbi:MAG TPA: hypothetical protein VHU19_04260 [Pyrinomonadaceae bacterium]|jgi:hypothetical protein|nr:hypothetical protein [Pyrinomonadaceae bacterium]
MKSCPTCNRTYTDEALAFCPSDGTPLVGVAPAYQQPATAPPPFQPAGQQYYPQNAPQMSFGQQAAGRSKGFAIAALLFGLVSFVLLLVATIRMRVHDWYYFRYSAHMPSDIIFWGLLTVGIIILFLAILLGLIALIQSFRTPARYGGRGLAFTGPFLGVLAALLTIGMFSYARMKAPSQTYPTDINTYSSNSNSYSSNSNTYSSNSNSYSSNSNTYSSSTSSSGTQSGSMSEDDKHRLFYAAAKTGDQKLMMQVSQKIGIIDQNGTPSSSYREFVKDTITWAFKDTEFIQTMNTPDKARAYVQSHL